LKKSGGLSENQLIGGEEAMKEQDIVILKESGKFMIKDIEGEEEQKRQIQGGIKNKLKRSRNEAFGEDNKSDNSSD
jgi:hypothetical protein